ncbi:MAG: hypothetical protein RJQ14_18885, partial [Marinoscillum sp.]
LPKSVRNDFYYYLVAVDTSFNRSPRSAYATATLPDVTPPERPFIESVDYSQEGIIVQWTQNVESDLSGYHVYRSDSAGGNSKRININLLAPYTYRYTDRSAVPNQLYYYNIEALDNVNNVSPRSADAFAKWHIDKELKDQIHLKIRSKRRRQVNRLEWSSISPSELKGYIIFRGQNERVVKPLTGIIKDTNTYSDKVEKDVGYFYQVRAYTTSGQVIYSPKVEQTIN